MKIPTIPLPYVAFLLVAMSLLVTAYNDQKQDIAVLRAQAALIPVQRQWVKKLEHRLVSPLTNEGTVPVTDLSSGT